MKKLFLLTLLLSLPLFAEQVPLFSAHPDRCRMDFNQQDFAFTIQCQSETTITHRYPVVPGPEMKIQVEAIEKVIATVSKKPEEDLKNFKAFLKAQLEEKFRYKFPTDEELLVGALKDFEQAEKIMKQDGFPCPDLDLETGQYKGTEVPITPYVDIVLDKESQENIQRMAVDKKMEEDGFVNLGRFKAFSIRLNTMNDNFLHGSGYAIWDRDWKRNDPPSWEGDDRGLTYAHDLKFEGEFEKGGISLRQYSKGYSQLTTQKVPVQVCDSAGNCTESMIESRRDEQNRRFQNFLSVDGLELEVRRNQVNGDMYLKVAGSVERLSDGSKGIAQTIQTEWHRTWKSRGMLQYHNVKHRDDEYRVNLTPAVGIEKIQNPISWFAVRETLEGKVNLSSAAKENTYVSVETSLAIDTGKLLGRDLKAPPLLQARVHASTQQYTSGKRYDQFGARLSLNIYSDKSGNVVGIYTGADRLDDPFIRRYGTSEIERRHRADIIHSYGVYARLSF